ncbi:MAG: hypothetical protein M3077_01040 [Candidatus Dormibacteraeota bacterium]|nr:hypothetical protein [Candidatus Dormibacteraeota bacterium]
MGRTDQAVVATFRRQQDAAEAVEHLRSAGIAPNQIKVEHSVPGLLESLLPEEERSGKSTVTVTGERSLTLAGTVLSQSGAQEVKGNLRPQTTTPVSPMIGNVAETNGRTTPSPSSTAEMADAKVRIESARSDMDQTIRAIEDRLKPDAVKARVKHAVKEATVGQMERKIGTVKDSINYNSSGVVERIRQNPMPAALAGLGLTWLFFSKKPAGRYDQRYYRPGSSFQPEYGYAGSYPNRQGDITQAPGRVADKAGEVAGQVTGTIGDAASQVGATVGETASQVGATVGETANQVGATVGQTASQVGETLGNTADQVRYTTGQWAWQAGQQVQRVQTNLQKTMEENPLPVGLAVLGLGALVALMVPKTSTEDRLLGETRDRLADTAQDVTQKVSRVAQRAGAAAQDEARSQNLA